MSGNPSHIPIYGLYGEPLNNSDPGSVHIEDIAYRSKDLGWIIKAHRHRKLFQIICIFDARLEVSLAEQTRQLEGNWIISIPPGVAHGFRFQPDSKGFVLSIDNSILIDSTEENLTNSFSPLQQAPQLMEFNAGDAHVSYFLDYIRLLRREFEQYQMGRNDALESLCKLALTSINRQLWSKRMHIELGSVDAQLLAKFWSLVETHYKEHWPIARYANEMHMSNSSLNRLCHQHFGINPKTLVQEKILREARRLLVYTKQSVEEVAYKLGFKDQAYFSRFFKKYAGISPGRYRKKADYK